MITKQLSTFCYQVLHGCGLTDSREISIDERQESDFVIKERRLEMVCASLVDGQW